MAPDFLRKQKSVKPRRYLWLTLISRRPRHIAATLRKSQAVPAHSCGEAKAGLQHVAGSLAGDQPLRQKSRVLPMSVLAGGNKADDTHFISAEMTAAGLMITDAPPRVALDCLH